MDPLYEYLVVINYHFIGLVIAAIMIGTLIVFGFLYYFYIEQTALIAYMSLYFVFVFFGLFCNSFIVLSTIGKFYAFTQLQLNAMHLLIDYFIVYSIFLIVTFILQQKLYKLKLMLLLLLAIIFSLSHVFNLQRFMFLAYLYILIGICVYLTGLKRKDSSKAKTLSLMIFFLSFILYYTLNYYELIVSIDWILSIIIVISVIAYFMYRYKHILMEKELLYNHLTHDFLTDIYSKSYFIEVLVKTREGIILFIDVNQFKWINDQLGHFTGDKVLKLFANKLSALSNDHVLNCRFGGDEFALLLTGMNIEESQFLATDIMNAFKETLKEANIDQNHNVGISIGLSTFTHFQGHNALVASDMAMYESKCLGNYKLNIHLEEGGNF